MLNICDRDLDILARTIYGEARGELNHAAGGIKSLQAIGWVVRNRTKQKQFSPYVYKVCMQPWQFSCWNLNDPNRKALLDVTLDDKVFQECYLAATSVLFNRVNDCTSGADHYHSTYIDAPYWAVGKTSCAKIGQHLFYKLGA
jgi:spore germination cell wall hydrolase CwlJ-like protein